MGTIGTTDTTRADYCPDLMLLYYPVLDLGPEGYSHEKVKERWPEISPLWHVSRQTPETLLMVGLEDRIAPYRVAERFQQALQQKGVRCELQGFPGLGHPLFLYRQPLNETFYEVRRLTDQFLQSVQYLIP
ncbi:MAG: prolyl oligopeptidase family serine peptidase [Parabacteroides sp.]|nr:prolyl oligopeptidase family serine peptidase [Parabacteroides sp.]